MMTRFRGVQMARACGRLVSVSHRSTSIRPPSSVPYTEQQERLGRPVSPHVTIYKQEITAISSIMNRICGSALAIGFAGASGVAATGGDLPTLIWSALQSAPPSVTPLAKFLVAYPLTYHWMAGVRHQFWDMYPEHINLNFAPKSSRAIVAASLLLSGIAGIVTLKGGVPVRPDPVAGAAKRLTEG